MYDEEALKPIREVLEHVRERLDFALSRLKAFDEFRCLRWRCVDCGYIQAFHPPDARRGRPALPEVRREEFRCGIVTVGALDPPEQNVENHRATLVFR